MDYSESMALLSFKGNIGNSVDPITFTSILLRNGYVRPGLYRDVERKFASGNARHEIVGFVIDELLQSCSFDGVIFSLYKCGYIEIACQLFVNAKFGNYRRPQGIPNAEVKNRKSLQTFFSNLKRLVHDSQFENPRRALRQLAVRFQADFRSAQTEQDRQRLADKCLVVLSVEVDAFYDSLGCVSEINQEQMLDEMGELVPHCSVPLLADTMCFTRRANLNAFRADFQQAEDMMVQSRCSARTIGRCLELVNMLYIEVYVKLWELERIPTRHNLDSVILWGKIGLECLTSEPESTQIMWRRMFILRMAFALLGLGNRANVISGFEVGVADIDEARKLLAVFDSCWCGIDVRREMFYCVARARLNEQLNKFEEACGFIQRAKTLAEEGRFYEKIRFIDDLGNVIKLKIQRPDTAISQDTCTVSFQQAVHMDRTDVVDNADNAQHNIGNVQSIYNACPDSLHQELISPNEDETLSDQQNIKPEPVSLNSVVLFEDRESAEGASVDSLNDSSRRIIGHWSYMPSTDQDHFDDELLFAD